MKGKRLLTKVVRKLKHSSPTILTFMGASGVVATTILAMRATPKALQIIEDNTGFDHYGEVGAPSKVETLQLTRKCYIPTVIVGASTIACILGANILNKRQQASIASLYGLLDQTYKEYRKAACEVYGEDADKKIQVQMAKDRWLSASGCMENYNTQSPELDGDSEKLLFYDSYSKRYFNATYAAVINAMYHINRDWTIGREIPMNDFYEFLGLDKIKGGDDIGWSWDILEEGYVWLDFDIASVDMEDGMQCLLISYFEPEPFEFPYE